MKTTIYTVGHSTHTAEKFLNLLLNQKITAIADVRSSPYSRFNPQFNRESLKRTLQSKGVRYVFLGEQLGARSSDLSCYQEGKVQYDKLAETDLFKEGIQRVLEGAKSFRIALMCAEKDPLDCHRTILVARQIVQHNVCVAHILENGTVESNESALARLRQQLGIEEADMFMDASQINSAVYTAQADRIAYVLPEPDLGRNVTSDQT